MVTSDSGASEHIFNRREFFKIVQSAGSTKVVELSDRGQLSAFEKGIVTFQFKNKVGGMNHLSL